MTPPTTPGGTTPGGTDDTGDTGNGGPEVLGEQASTGPKHGGKNTPQPSSQVEPTQQASPSVAGEQQSVPTAINAGEDADAVEGGLLVPAGLATLGALFGLGALAVRRRRA